MVWIPGGEFSMGAADAPGMNIVGMQATIDSRPIHRVSVDGFWMDKTPVTNEEFARFVDATGVMSHRSADPSRRSVAVVQQPTEPWPTANPLPRRPAPAVINERVVQPLRVSLAFRLALRDLNLRR